MRVVDPDKVIGRQDWGALVPHLLKLEVDPNAATARLRAFTRLLLEWNFGISNLISRHDVDRVLDRHIRESVEPGHWLKSSGAKRWMDLGTGGGFPALPLALLGVGTSWTLVESRRNKTLFVRKVIQDLAIPGLDVITDRLENLLGTEHEQAYDGFTSRATMTLGPTLALAREFVKPGGVAFLWKGSQREREMAENPEWQEHWSFEGLLGIGSGQSVVARFKRFPI
ncbi:MAG: 16S rRNA (guanine(527)-N(7))-methyltransferase RsmG [Candidatus Eisenbacteria bacterium]|nr:16S rRNA (guanine(527)-N(7))-methyltransferase RsmG [Candidatus Eisenbacteria bacterium]